MYAREMHTITLNDLWTRATTWIKLLILFIEQEMTAHYYKFHKTCCMGLLSWLMLSFGYNLRTINWFGCVIFGLLFFFCSGCVVCISPAVCSLTHFPYNVIQSWIRTFMNSRFLERIKTPKFYMRWFFFSS